MSQPTLETLSLIAQSETLPRANPSEVLWQRVKTWLKRAVATSTATGLFIVTVYFLKIGYLPIDSFSSMASLGGIVALLASALLASFAILWGAPTAVVFYARSTPAWLDISHRFWSHKVSATPSNPISRISAKRVVGVVALTIALPWFAILVTYIPDFDIADLYKMPLTGLMVVSWVAGLIWFTHAQRPPVSEFGPVQMATGMAGYGYRVGWFFFFSLSATYPLYAFVKLSTLSTLDISGASALWLWIGCGILVVVALHSINLGIELNRSLVRSTPVLAFQMGATIFCVLALLITLGASSNVQDRLMQIVAVRTPHAHVVVTKSTCEALRLAGVSAMRYAPFPGEVATESCILFDVTVLSRLGTQWRIACNTDTDAATHYRGFNIDAKEVLTLVDVQRPITNGSDSKDVCKGMWTP